MIFMKKNILAFVILFSSFCFADKGTVLIEGMNCGGCVKQVNKLVCQDKEVSTWFSSCSSEVVDADKQIGKLVYSTAQTISLDAAKKKKIENIIVESGRKVLEFK